MSKGHYQERGFVLELGVQVRVPEDAFFQVPRSGAKFGESLPLIGFLQEVALAPHERGRKVVERRYEFATRNTGGKGLKCFLPSDPRGKVVQVVMTFTNNDHPRQASSVAMHFPLYAESYMLKYRIEQEDALTRAGREKNRGDSMVSAD